MSRRSPDVSIHIDRLILDGLPIGFHDVESFREALEAQIASVLGGEGAAERLASLPTSPVLRARAIIAGPRDDASKLGHSVAGSLGEALGL